MLTWWDQCWKSWEEINQLKHVKLSNMLQLDITWPRISRTWLIHWLIGWCSLRSGLPWDQPGAGGVSTPERQLGLCCGLRWFCAGSDLSQWWRDFHILSHIFTYFQLQPVVMFPIVPQSNQISFKIIRWPCRWIATSAATARRNPAWRVATRRTQIH